MNSSNFYLSYHHKKTLNMFLFPVENMEDFFQVYNYIQSDQNRGEFKKRL